MISSMYLSDAASQVGRGCWRVALLWTASLVMASVTLFLVAVAMTDR